MSISRIFTFIEKEFKEVWQNSLLVVVFFTPIVIPLFLGRDFLGGKVTFNMAMWVCFGATMAGTSIVSIILAEEKEKKILNMILISPTSRLDILAGKSFFGVFTTFVTCVIISYISGGYLPSEISFYIIVLLGSIVLSAIGILIGLVAPNQTAAEIIITPAFIILLLPAFLVGTSELLDKISYLLPSYYFFHGIIAVLNGDNATTLRNILILIGYSVVIYGLSIVVFRKIKRG